MKRAPRPTPRVVVIGFGRLGGAIALGLRRKKWQVATLPRSGASVRRAVSLKVPLADMETLKDARIAILAVPDSAVSRVAADLVADLHSSCALVHCAGALRLDVLKVRGEKRSVGSLHPLCAVSSPEDPLAGHTAAISASGPALAGDLRRIAEALGLETITVDEKKRAAYHAAAVLSAGGLVSLLSSAVETMNRAGVREEDASRALIALMRSALRGVEARGIRDGLTGPVVRGDSEVVASHVRAVPRGSLPLYRALMLRSLAVAGDRVPRAASALIRRVLSG